MDVRERLRSAGGVARAREIARTRRERRELHAATEAAVVVPLGKGWFALPDVPPPIVRAKRMGAVISCVSVADFYGLPRLTADRRTHLAVARNRHVPERSLPVAEVLLHRESRPPRDHHHGVPVAPPVDALPRVLRCASTTEAVAMVDAALNRRLVTAEQLEQRLAGPGSVRGRVLLAACDGRSRSALESVARLVLRRAGFVVVPGVRVEDVGEVDLLVEGRVVVECDGFAYHSGRHEYREDRRRDRALVARGLVVLRFTYEEIMARPAYCVAEVRRALAART